MKVSLLTIIYSFAFSGGEFIPKRLKNSFHKDQFFPHSINT